MIPLMHQEIKMHAFLMVTVVNLSEITYITLQHTFHGDWSDQADQLVLHGSS